MKFGGVNVLIYLFTGAVLFVKRSSNEKIKTKLLHSK